MSAFAELSKTGTPHDLYYSGRDNSLIQAAPLSYNTRLNQAFTSLGAGTNAFLIPANSGLKCPVLVFGYDAGALAGQAGFANALPASWGYTAIESVSWRVGGSQQLFMSGAQLMARNLRLCKTKSQRDAIAQLGGSAVGVAAGDYAIRQYAYIPLTFWSDPCVDSLSPPLASDLLSSQTQVTVSFKPAASFWLTNPVSVPVAPPPAFSKGYFVMEQLEMVDRSMSLANRDGGLANQTYIQRINSYDQQELTASLNGVPGVQTLTFAGVMAGGVRALQVFLTADNDESGRMIAPDAITVIYAGQRYSVYQDGAAAIFNLIDSSAPNYIDTTALLPSIAPGGAWTANPAQSTWVMCPFGQPLGSDMEATITIRGQQISNGSITLDLVAPVGGTSPTYTVHLVPIFTAAIAYSRGSANILIG